MKAFKGCVNEICSAYKKIHYKDADMFCSKCGEPLFYVCADCWTQLEVNENRYCIRCRAIREDKKDQRFDRAQDGVKAVVGAIGIGAGALAKVAKDVNKGADAMKVIGNTAKKATKFIPKK